MIQPPPTFLSNSLLVGMFIGFFLLAGLFAILWVRGDRRRKLRRCTRCWYDMSDIPTLTCPECGRTARSEARLHRARRHPVHLLAAIGFALLGIMTVGFHAHRNNWHIQSAPTWLLSRLVWKIESRSPDTYLEIWRELATRTLTPDDFIAIVDGWIDNLARDRNATSSLANDFAWVVLSAGVQDADIVLSSSGLQPAPQSRRGPDEIPLAIPRCTTEIDRWIREIRPAISGSNNEVAFVAITALCLFSEHSDAAIPVIVEGLRKRETREYSLRAIHTYLGSRSIPALHALVTASGADVDTREAVARVLSELASSLPPPVDPGIHHALLASLHDQDSGVVFEALCALSDHPPSAELLLPHVPALVPAFEISTGRTSNGRDYSARKIVPQLIRPLGEPAVPALLKLLTDSRPVTRATAASLLADIASDQPARPSWADEAREQLAKMTQDVPLVRDAAKRALEELN